MVPRRIVTVLLLAAAAVTVTACGSSSSSSSSSTTTTAAPPPSTTSTTSSPTTTTTTTTTLTTSTTVRLATCAFSQLSVTGGQQAAGLGHEGVPLLFRNTSTATCALEGYPGVAGLDAAGDQVVQAVRTPSGYLGGLNPGTTTPPAVTLAPGQLASAMVEGTDMPTGTETSCPQYPALLVTPPGATQSVHVTAALPGCSPIQVHPVVPGSTGSAE